MESLKKNLILLEQPELGNVDPRQDRDRNRTRDDSYTVIIARAFLLFILTFDLWMNAYVLMSLDRNNLMIGVFTIVTCAIGQFSAITGQFGYPIGDTLLKIFNLCGVVLLVASVLSGQFGNNFMTQLSFVLSLTGILTGIFIMLLRAKDQ